MRFADLAQATAGTARAGLQDAAKARSAGVETGRRRFKPTIEAEGREAVREIVASGAGVGFVSRAEFGQDGRLRPIVIDAPEMLMDEALICLRERSSGKLVKAFFDIARQSVDAEEHGMPA